MVTYTSSATYWSPLKPRIRIYALQDTTYAAPIYSYNPFTDVGETTKPIALSFDSQTTNAGTFSIEIEDKDTQLDPDTFTKGNRVFIDCSKDGTTFQPAFKGLVRSTEQNIYATTGRNLIFQGYSYLVRLNERVVNMVKQASLSGIDYDRTDSAMFTNNLVNDILSSDSNYVNSVDDTQLYSIFKKNNIASSQIVEWIPRLDAQLVTVNDAINSVLETSNGLVMLNPADDELMLYTSDLITSATGIFLLTNQINENADDADYTMYPLEGYKYNVSYDFPDSGSRLIGSIGSFNCPETAIPRPDTPALDIPPDTQAHLFMRDLGGGSYDEKSIACQFRATQTDCLNLSINVAHFGDATSLGNFTAKIRVDSSLTAWPGSQIGSTMTFYKNGIPDTPWPEYSVHNQMTGLPKDATGVTGLTIGTLYFLDVRPPSGQTSGAGGHAFFWHKTQAEEYDKYGGAYSTTHTWPGYHNFTGTPGSYTLDGPLPWWEMSFTSNIISPECGGNQATLEADAVFAVAHDRNMSNRLGVVERTITGIPTHIKTRQTLDEYLFNKLYYAAKPRFTFDFPSVTMPNKIPKAGDICAHVDTRTNTGLADAAIQTGVISSVSYDFTQGTDGALGLRKIGLSTTGVRRGSY